MLAYHLLNASCIESDRTIRHQPLNAKTEARTEGWLPEGEIVIGVTSGASTPNSEVEGIIRRVAEVVGAEIR